MASDRSTTRGSADRNIFKARETPPHWARTRTSERRSRGRLIPAALAIAFALAGWGEAAAARGNQILRIDVEGEGPQRQVRIVTSSEPTFTVFRLSNPMRVVVDVSGGELSGLDTPIVVEDGVIGHIAARQFSADGFLVGRVIVGFEMDLSYNVRAEGNAVVVRTGPSPNALVDRAIPPPIAPVDRAAAERFVTAKQEAETAARHAVSERQQAERTAANARLQQEEAERLRAKAGEAQGEADRARAEVEKLKLRVQEAAARDKAAAEASALEAERRLKQLQREAERIAAARAEAERTAGAAEQARREAEQIAARAEADHKKRQAELEAEVARAAKEKKAAKEAWDRAKGAQQEAAVAERKADRAKREAEVHRAEIDKKLTDVSRREREVAAQRERAEDERAVLDKKRDEILARDRELDKRRTALAAAGRDVKADRKKIAAERAELNRLRDQLKKDAAEAAERETERHRAALATKLDEIERRERDLVAQRERAAKQTAALEKREAEVQARDRALEAERAKLEANGQDVKADKKKVAAERAKLSELREKLQQEKTQVTSEQGTLDRSRKQIEAQWRAIAAERKNLTQERDELAKEQQRLRQRHAEIAGLETSLDQRRAGLEAAEAVLATTQQSLDSDRKALATAEEHVEKQQNSGRKQTDRERHDLQQEETRLAKEAARLAALKEESAQESRRLTMLREGLAAEQARLGKDRQQLAKDEDQLSQRRRELQQRADATNAKATVPVAALIKPEQQHTAVASTGAIQPSWSSGSRGGRASLVGVERRGRGEDSSILLALKGAPEYQVQRIVDPPRLVIDLLDTTRGTERTTFGIQSTYVRKVRLGDHGSMLRAVLDLSANNAEHEVTETRDGLLVSLRTVVPHPSAPESQPQPTPAKPTPAKMTEGTLALRDVRFAGDDEVARIVLDIDRDVGARVDNRSAKAWVLELDNASVPKSLERSLDTTAYGTVVRLVSTYQAGPGAVKIVANLTGPATHKLIREDGSVIWEIRGAGERHAVAAAAAPKAAGFAEDAAVLARSTPTESRRKKRISIDLKDADIVNVLRLLSEVSGENIITSDEVTGKITLRLRNVPWDRALDTILKSKGYDMVRQDNILRIAPAEVIQRERERELDKRNAKAKVEETVIKIITVNYATATDISGQLQPMLSARGSVQVDDRTNTIIVEDIRSNIDRVVQLTRRLDKQTPQVLIEARIVEASTNQLEHLGIQWGGTSQQSTVTGNPTGLLFPSDILASGAADDVNRNQEGGIATPSRYAVNLPAPIGSGSGGGIGFVFGSAGGSQVLNLRLTALEESGKGRIISSPRITTLDNRKATISQGVDIPVSVVSAAGVNTRFIQARLKLEVTPHVTNDGSVLMKIAAEKNEPDFANTGGAGDPSIIKKEAVTEVLVRDGETTVIGGIYTRNTSDVESGIPFLSKIPLLGALFRSSRTEDNRSEMLIFVTPRIVNREASAIQPSSLTSESE